MISALLTEYKNVKTAVFSDNGQFLAIGIEYAVIVLMIPSLDKCEQFICSKAVFHLQFSPSSKMVLALEKTCSVNLFCPTDSNVTRLLSGHSKSVLTAIFISDYTVISSSEDNSMRAWDIGTGACVESFAEFPGKYVQFSVLPSGTMFAAAQTSPITAFLVFNSVSFDLIISIQCDNITSVCFVRDDLLVCGQTGQKITLYNPTKPDPFGKKEVRVLFSTEQVYRVMPPGINLAYLDTTATYIRYSSDFGRHR